MAAHFAERTRYSVICSPKTSYLSLPLIASFSNLLVRVAHHSYQHVHQQDGQDAHVNYKKKLKHRV
jgi:hypothetical protein